MNDSQRGATNVPILALLAVNITSGTMANGNCRLSTTWLKMSSWPVPFSPYQIVTTAAGMIAIARVISRLAQGGSLISRKPSITTCPANGPSAAVTAR